MRASIAEDGVDKKKNDLRGSVAEAGAGDSDDGDDVTIETVYLSSGPCIERSKFLSRVKKKMVVTIVTQKDKNVKNRLVFASL